MPSALKSAAGVYVTVLPSQFRSSPVTDQVALALYRPIFDTQSGRWYVDVEIDRRSPWARKHVATLRHYYARAPFLDPALAVQTSPLFRRRIE